MVVGVNLVEKVGIVSGGLPVSVFKPSDVVVVAVVITAVVVGVSVVEKVGGMVVVLPVSVFKPSDVVGAALVVDTSVTVVVGTSVPVVT